MPSAVADTYAASSGATLRAGRYASRLSGGLTVGDVIAAGTLGSNASAFSGGLTLDGVAASGALAGYIEPAWMAGRAIGEWFEIAGTGLAGSAGGPGETPGNQFSASAQWVADYSGIALRRRDSRLMGGAHGGHSGTTDNRAVSIGLEVDAPAWRMDVVKSTAGNVLLDPNSFNADNKPSSTHTYWTEQWVESRNRMMKFGSISANGGAGGTLTPNKSFGLDVDGGAWDAPSTWANSPGGFGGCIDPATDNVYFARTTVLSKWTAATDTWSDVASSGSAICYNPLAWDTSRGQVFSLAWGDGNDNGSGVLASRFTSAGTVRTAITFNASAAYTEFTAGAPNNPFYAGMTYDEVNDRYLYYWGGRTVGRSRVFVITPNAGTVWDMSFLSVSGVTPPAIGNGGTYNRFVYVPRLRGCALLATGYTPVLFLRTA